MPGRLDCIRLTRRPVVARTGRAQLLPQHPHTTLDGCLPRCGSHASPRTHAMQEEHAEKAMRLAEMEAQKATNMMEHQDEIAARPARTWFQTPREKKRAAEAAKEDPKGKGPKPKKGGQDKTALKGKRRREREAEEQDSKSQRPHLREVRACMGQVCPYQPGPGCHEDPRST